MSGGKKAMMHKKIFEPVLVTTSSSNQFNNINANQLWSPALNEMNKTKFNLHSEFIIRLNVGCQSKPPPA